MIAYAQLQKLRAGDRTDSTRALFEKHKDDLGFGLLLKKYTANVVDATPEQKQAAADDTIPKVAPLFWSFRIMVGLGMLFLFIFASAFYFLAIRNLAPQRWLMRLAVISIPLPWIAAELGWFVAEYGRQPWTISGVLPTFLSVSSLEVSSVYASLAAFVVFYTALFVIEMYLMLKYVRLGPGSLGTGRYFGEASAPATAGTSSVRQPAGAGED
jgi:cytochrome d ubiquinol oxidase subunit I